MERATKTVSLGREHIELLERLAREQDREQGVIVARALERYAEVSK